MFVPELGRALRFRALRPAQLPDVQELQPDAAEQAVTALIVAAAIDPPLSAEDAAGLSPASRDRVVLAILRAHPTTARLLRGELAGRGR